MGLTTLLDVHNSRVVATRTAPVRRALLDVKNAATPAKRTTLLDSKKAAPGVVSGGAPAHPPASGLPLWTGDTYESIQTYINNNSSVDVKSVISWINSLDAKTHLTQEEMEKKYINAAQKKPGSAAALTEAKLDFRGKTPATATDAKNMITNARVAADTEIRVMLNDPDREKLILLWSLLHADHKDGERKTIVGYLKAGASKMPTTKKFLLADTTSVMSANKKLPLSYIWAHANDASRTNILDKLGKTQFPILPSLLAVFDETKKMFSVHIDHCGDDINATDSLILTAKPNIAAINALVRLQYSIPSQKHSAIAQAIADMDNTEFTQMMIDQDGLIDVIDIA